MGSSFEYSYTCLALRLRRSARWKCLETGDMIKPLEHSNLLTFQPSKIPTFQHSNLPTFQPSNLPTLYSYKSSRSSQSSSASPGLLCEGEDAGVHNHQNHHEDRHQFPIEITINTTRSAMEEEMRGFRELFDKFISEPGPSVEWENIQVL